MKKHIKESPVSALATLFGIIGLLAVLLVESGLIEGSKAFSYSSEEDFGNHLVLIIGIIAVIIAFVANFMDEKSRLQTIAFYAAMLPLLWYFAIYAIIILVAYIALHNFLDIF